MYCCATAMPLVDLNGVLLVVFLSRYGFSTLRALVLGARFCWTGEGVSIVIAGGGAGDTTGLHKHSVSIYATTRIRYARVATM